MFKSMNISILIFTGSKQITLLNITLISNFFINIIFLHKFTSKDVY